MKYRKNVKWIFLILLLFMAIGFAYLSSRLHITGTAEFVGQTWNIYFDNVVVKEGSVLASSPVIDATKTTVSYSVSFTNPGDYYEFSVDAINAGTIDAMVDSVVKTNLNESILQYITYDVTYSDGKPIQRQDVLEANHQTTYKVLVAMNSLPDEKIDLTLDFTVTYVQSNVEKTMTFREIAENSAESDSFIDFKQKPSDTNGNGLYVRNGTQTDSNPIYYYRGAVENNNAFFAGYCWKIVRTTETGGTKLLYSGKLNSNGECGNYGTLAFSSVFNEKSKSPTYVGYMHGDVYEPDDRTIGYGKKFGKSFTYSNGMYTLVDIANKPDANHHYSCLSSETSCSQLSYIYHVNGGTDASYIVLSDGEDVGDALSEMYSNKYDSKIKINVDNWFSTKFIPYFTDKNKNYNDYLEDTVWCNDRSWNTLGSVTTYTNNGWKPNGGAITNSIYYAAYGRITEGVPIFGCPNKNDSFTVEDTVRGNGTLTYPVGLLTADEVYFAGSASYMYNNADWLTMTPYSSNLFDSVVYLMSQYSSLAISDVDTTGRYVRPSISLKENVKIRAGGDGTKLNPYEFIVK